MYHTYRTAALLVASHGVFTPPTLELVHLPGLISTLPDHRRLIVEKRTGFRLTLSLVVIQVERALRQLSPFLMTGS